MSRKKYSAIQLTVGLSATLFVSLCYGQRGYYVEKVNVPAALTDSTTAYINNVGQIVITDVIDNAGGSLSYLVEVDQVTPLSDINVRNLNDNGQVVGDCDRSGQVACFWDKESGFVYLEGAQHPDGFLTPLIGSDININGQVVGSASAGGTTVYAYTWDSIRGTQIIGRGWGNSITDDGTVYVTTNSSGQLWNDGELTYDNINVYSVAGINTDLLAYSTYSVWDPLTGVRAFGSNFRGSDTAHAINERSQIVGYRGASAALWDNGEVFNLKDLLLDNPGWELTVAYDNNNAGQIVGRGVLNGEESLFLLTPEPIAGPPSIGGNSYSLSTVVYSPLPERRVTLFDINQSGEVIGSVAYVGGFKWTEDQGIMFLEDVNNPLMPISAQCLNENGDVGGQRVNSLGMGPSYIWPSESEQLPLTGKPYSVNENNYAVVYTSSRQGQLVNYVTGASWNIDNNAGTYTYLVPRGLNNSQNVVGQAWLAGGGYESFIYDVTTGTRSLDMPGSSSKGVAINDNGDILGQSIRTDADLCYGHCASVYKATDGWSALPGLESSLGNIAYDMNEVGDIVGLAYTARGTYPHHAVIWKNGQAYDLNDLIDPTLGWELISAKGISDDGRIVGEAWVNNEVKPFILTPQEALVVDVCPSGCPYNSIQAAIDAKPYGGTIVVGNGTYNESITLSSEKTLLSVNGAASTIIDASGLNSSVVVMSVGSVIDGFTLTGGNTSSGGGIRAIDDVVVRNVVITGNSASSGGGIFSSGTLHLEKSIVTNNSVNGSGGGLYLSTRASAALVDSRFESNSAADGGAVYLASLGALSIDKSVFKGNSAYRQGGGVYIYLNSTATVSNSLIVNNNGGWFGGGGVYSRSVISVMNTTIAGNSASRQAGLHAPAGSVVVNSILWGNNGGNASGGFGITYSITDVSGTGNINVSPLFVDVVNGDYHLQSGSPAIDSGSDLSGSGVADDLDGVARPLDGDGLGVGGAGDGSDYDIGAYEYRL